MTPELVLDSKIAKLKNKVLALRTYCDVEESDSDEEVTLLTRNFKNFPLKE